jgi:hypothetical protein
MIREEVRFLGCGFNKAKYAGHMKYCIEHGLDFGIYKLGPRRIKKMIQRKFGIELEIEGKDLHTVTKEAQEIIYN